jgi:putative redox protein
MASQFDSPAGVVARAAEGRFATRIDLPGGPIVADEPLAAGGGGAGPTPYQLLSAALAACTSMTLRLYGRHNDVAFPSFRVEVVHALVAGTPPRDRFSRRLIFDAPIDSTLRARLLEIAAKCPVHRTLSGGGAIILTSAEGPPPPPLATLEPMDSPAAHLEQMEQASTGGDDPDFGG